MWAIPYKWLTLGCLGQFYPATGGKCKLPETYCSEIGLLLAEDVAWQSFACHCNCWRGTIHGQSTRFFHFIEKWFKTATREIAWNLREIPSLPVKVREIGAPGIRPILSNLCASNCLDYSCCQRILSSIQAERWKTIFLKERQMHVLWVQFFFTQKSWFCCEIGIGSWYLSSLFWSNH